AKGLEEHIRRRFVLHRILLGERPEETAEAHKLLPRFGVAFQMLIDGPPFVVVEGVQQITKQVGFHDYTSSSVKLCLSASCNLNSAACSRDFTVPTGMSKMSAISRYLSP